LKISNLFGEFFNSERAGGIILLSMTGLSLLLSNSALQAGYLDFWKTEVGNHSITSWINDGLMAVFFLLIGLELEREIYMGELSNLRKASLPIFAAAGGMLIPATIYILFNFGTTFQPGAGIPMATDIAFAIGILSLLGNKVPISLKIFLTALAVIDDMGAIIVIAIFYTGSIDLIYLLGALAVFIVLIFLNRARVNNLLIYLSGGIAIWFLLLNSGVHATLAGVMLAFAIPFGNGDERSPSFRMHHYLHKPVAFLVLPLFALANTAITFDGNFFTDLTQQYGLGIMAGLIAGKPAGIFLFSWLAVSTGISEKPADIRWPEIAGIGFLGGIGFTMSIFILLLAFDNNEIVNNAKAAILTGSLISGITGYIFLKSSLK
jgi:NhaA family Na+:H+ antiporter